MVCWHQPASKHPHSLSPTSATQQDRGNNIKTKRKKLLAWDRNNLITKRKGKNQPQGGIEAITHHLPQADQHPISPWTIIAHRDAKNPNPHLPLPQFLLANTRLHGLEHPFGQSRSSGLAVSPSQPTHCLGRGVKEQSLHTVQALLSSS